MSEDIYRLLSIEIINNFCFVLQKLQSFKK